MCKSGHVEFGGEAMALGQKSAPTCQMCAGCAGVCAHPAVPRSVVAATPSEKNDGRGVPRCLALTQRDELGWMHVGLKPAHQSTKWLRAAHHNHTGSGRVVLKPPPKSSWINPTKIPRAKRTKKNGHVAVKKGSNSSVQNVFFQLLRMAPEAEGQALREVLNGKIPIV